MSFSLFSHDKEIYGIKNYIADTADDLINIPKNAGNKVFVINESKYYICDNKGLWVEVAGGGSGPEPKGTLLITTNGIKDVAAYAQVDVNIPIGIFPEGQIILSDLDEVYDVSNYATAIINIPLAEESEF